MSINFDYQPPRAEFVNQLSAQLFSITRTKHGLLLHITLGENMMRNGAVYRGRFGISGKPWFSRFVMSIAFNSDNFYVYLFGLVHDSN